MKLAVERLGADPAPGGGVGEERARQRDQYVKTYYGRHRHDVTNYDLVVNAERLGFERAAGRGVAPAGRTGGGARGTRAQALGTRTATNRPVLATAASPGCPPSRVP